MKDTVPQAPQDRPMQEEHAGANTSDTSTLTGYHVHDSDLTQRTRLHWVETPKGYWVVSSDGQRTYLLEVRQQDERLYAPRGPPEPRILLRNRE
jgi:hypothetical protein